MSTEVMSSNMQGMFGMQGGQGMFGMHGGQGMFGTHGSHGLSNSNGLSGNGNSDSDSGLQELPEGVKQLVQQIMAAIAEQMSRQSSNSSESSGAGALGAAGGGGGGGGFGGGGFGGGGSPFPMSSKAAVTPSASSDATPAGSLTDPTSNASDDALDAADLLSDDDDDTTPSALQSATQGTALTKNAGGVSQAAAISGIDPKSSQVMQTGTGTDKTFNYTDDTDREESITYSDEDSKKATMTLEPGETGTFIGGSSDMGVRISPSDAKGDTHTDEVLFEDGGAGEGQASGVGNEDISKVDGNKDYNGIASNMTITLSDGRLAGDGNKIRAYQNSTDDAAAMGLAGDPSKTVNIVQSDVSAAKA